MLVGGNWEQPDAGEPQPDFPGYAYTLPSSTTYDLYRGLVSGAETLYQSGLTSTSFLDTDIANGATYFYYVVKIVDGVSSGPSNEMAVAVNCPCCDWTEGNPCPGSEFLPTPAPSTRFQLPGGSSTSWKPDKVGCC